MGVAPHFADKIPRLRRVLVGGTAEAAAQFLPFLFSRPWWLLPKGEMWPVWCLAGLFLFVYLFTPSFSKHFLEVGGRGEELTATEQ